MNISLDGVNTHYTVSGKGSHVILLHGWGTNLHTFAHIQQSLSQQFEVYALDFPGFGQSDDPPHAWGIADYSVFLERFIEKLQIESPTLIGHSFGGRVAIRYASEHVVQRMILVGSAGVKPKRSLQYYGKMYTFKAAKQLFRLPLLRHYADDVIATMKRKFGSSDYKNVSGVMQQTMVKVVNEDLRKFMPSIHAPVLLLWGENDTATPVSDAKQMEALMPNAGLAILKNAGHFSYLDKPRQFQIIIDHFLKSDQGGKHD